MARQKLIHLHNSGESAPSSAIIPEKGFADGEIAVFNSKKTDLKDPNAGKKDSGLYIKVGNDLAKINTKDYTDAVVAAEEKRASGIESALRDNVDAINNGMQGKLDNIKVSINGSTLVNAEVDKAGRVITLTDSQGLTTAVSNANSALQGVAHSEEFTGNGKDANIALADGKIAKEKLVKTVRDSLDAANAALPAQTYNTFVAGTDGDLKSNLAAVQVTASAGSDQLVTAENDTAGRVITVGTTSKLQTAVSDLGLKSDNKEKDTAFARIAKNAADIAAINTAIAGGTHFKGVLKAKPEDTKGYANGDIIVISGGETVDEGLEFICADGVWYELGNSTAEGERITKLENFNKTAFVAGEQGAVTSKVKTALKADDSTKAYGQTKNELLAGLAKTTDIKGGKAAKSGHYISEATLANGVLTVNELQLPVRSVTANSEAGTNGTILVNGSEVAVKGLQNAAFMTKASIISGLATTGYADQAEEDAITAAKNAGDIAYAVKGTEDRVKTLEGYFEGSKAKTAAAADTAAKIATSKAIGGATTPVYVASDGTVTAGNALGASAYHADDYFATGAEGDLARSAVQSFSFKARPVGLTAHGITVGEGTKPVVDIDNMVIDCGTY